MDIFSIRTEAPEVLPNETPHGCYEGWVYIGHMVEDLETGEEVERVEAVPCRRCSAGDDL